MLALQVVPYGHVYRSVFGVKKSWGVIGDAELPAGNCIAVSPQ
jgi:hypothetical protein